MEKELLEYRIKNPDKNVEASAKRIERLYQYNKAFSTMIQFFTTCNALNSQLEEQVKRLSQDYSDLLARMEVEKQMDEL